jgi:hypothetical protein
MKIELEKIKTAMVENGVDEATIEAIMKQLEAEAAEEVQLEAVDEQPTNEDLTDNAEDLPKVKYEYVIILNDKEGYLKDKEIAGWVVQQEENADAGLILTKLKDAAKDQNEKAKRKKNAITTLEDLFDGLKAKFLKSKYIKIKTKDLTRVIVSNGKF